MPATYEPIATKTFTSATVSTTFSNISQDYRDLIIVMSTNGASASSPYIQMLFNGDSSSSYDGPVAAAATGSSSGGWWGSTGNSNFNFTYYNPSSSAQVFFHATILDYNQLDKNKTVLVKQGVDGGGPQEFMTATYRKTNAITSLAIYSWGSVGYNAGTTISLYGIRA